MINDPFISTKYMVYLFKYDSTHGPYPLPLKDEKEYIVISNGKYNFSSLRSRKSNIYLSRFRSISYFIENVVSNYFFLISYHKNIICVSIA